MSTWEVIRAADGRITLSLPDIGGIRLSPDDAERLADALMNRPKYLGAGPLTWRTSGGHTPESVRGAHARHSFPKGAVVAMLDAAEHAHFERLYAENAEGGKARGIVHAVARALGVDLGAGIGDVWSETNMQRVVDEVSQRMDELENLRLTTVQDKRHMDFQAGQISQLTDDLNRWEGRLPTYGLEDEAAMLRATVVRQALEITELKGESE